MLRALVSEARKFAEDQANNNPTLALAFKSSPIVFGAVTGGGPIMDKALERLSGASGVHGQTSGNMPSKGFQNLIRGIAESKTKHEEDRIVRTEALFLKERMGDPEITTRQMKELLIRLLYCEMLGIDCSWGHIHAVKLSQKGNIAEKRIGYLTASLFLQEGNELNMLLVNTLQKDLKSANILEVSMAMSVICKLVGKEMIPAFIPLIQEKLAHPKELIRKKALMVLHRFHQLSPVSISHLFNDIKRCLSDSDPGVMDTCLVLLCDVIKDDPSHYKILTPSLVHILNQVIDRKLPVDFDYHTVPAPWIQMKVLQVMAVLGADDQKTSTQFYDVLSSTLASAECTSNIGLAISYECIKTITSIHHDPSLAKRAAHAVGRFLNSTNNNWKCLGITALGLLVHMDTSYTVEHQLVVIDCLDDPDDTLKRKTLSLLFKMTNSLNVVVITEKLLAYLSTTHDEYIKSDLVSKITQLAERYAPDNQWFIKTMNIVFELGGDLVRKEVAHNLMRLLAEGTEDDDVDTELRQEAVLSYLELLDKPNLPDMLVKIVCWVVGEYAYLCENMSSEEILNKMVSLFNRKFSDSDTLGWVITAVTKLISQIGTFSDIAQSHIACHLASSSTDAQQRCTELTELSQGIPFMQQVLPVDASCEDLEIDPSLSFLDDYVSEALGKGASPYKPAHMRQVEKAKEEKKATVSTNTSEINFTPYKPPSTQPVYQLPPSATSYQDDGSASVGTTTQPALPSATHSGAPVRGEGLHPAASESTYSESESPRLAVRNRVWGSAGYSKKSLPQIASAEPAAAPVSDDSVSDQADSVKDSDDTSVPVQGDQSVEDRVASSKVTAIPVMSAEEVKKRQLASALFGSSSPASKGGLLSGAGRTPRKQQKRESAPHVDTTAGKLSLSSPARKPSTPSTSSASNPSQTDLLLDIDFGTSTPSTTTATAATLDTLPSSTADSRTQPAATTASVGSAGGLFESLDMRPQPMATAPSGGNTAGGTLTDLADLFGSVTISQQNTPPAAIAGVNGRASNPPQANSSSGASLGAGSSVSVNQSGAGFGGGRAGDLFGSLLDMQPSSQQAVPVQGEQQPLAVTLFESPLSESRIPAELERYPSTPGGKNMEVCCDDSLRVTVTKVMKPEELVLVFFLTNQKQVGLTDIWTSIDASSSLKVTLTDPHHDNFFFDQLSGFGTSRHLCTVVPTSPGHNMNLHGKITYKLSMSTKRLFFDLNIPSVDLIRPLVIDTDAFGNKWGSFKSEKRQKKVNSHVKTPEMYMEVVKSKLNLHPIQIIGREAIAAGTFLPSTVCLLHAKLASSGLDIWVKSPSSVLTESFSKESLNALSSS